MNHTRPIDRLLDVFVFAPIGVAVALRDDLAGLAANGRHEVEVARELGRITIRVGQRRVAKRRQASRSAGAAGDSERPLVRPADPVPARPAAVRRAATAEAVKLPIADYDSLAASQVIARLGALDGDELDAVRTYELSHRGRRTILGKIDQLQAS